VIERALERAGESERLLALQKPLDESDGRESDVLMGYLMLLRENAAEPVVELLGRITQARHRRAICEALVHLCRSNWKPLTRKLSGAPWFVTRNILYIIARLADPKLLDSLRPVARHPEARVRRELIKTLQAFKGPLVIETLIELVQDSEDTVRIMAVRALGATGDPHAEATLLEIIGRKDFTGRKLDERRELFEALGHVANAGLLPVFRRMLRRGARAWFNRAIKEEWGLCAVAALRAMAQPEARETLQEGLRGRSRAIRDACREAIETAERGN
jgi:HEAT repeat protein